MRKEIENWWKQTRADLEKAKTLFNNKHYDGVVFYCQQSIEKGLKALLLKEKKKIIKIHDLVKLGKEVNLPDNLLNYCKEITQVYIYSRYPDIKVPKNLNDIASNYLIYTKRILKWIKEQL